MPTPYTSIFDGPTIITRKDLCDMLNLDLTRPDLKFSDAEIKKAYRVRALRFHPDKQATSDQPIPEQTCQQLIEDMGQARDYLLKGIDNIPGKGYLANARTYEVKDWVATVIGALQALKTGTSTLSTVVPWLSRFSNNFLMIGLMSTFWDGQLNLRLVNLFSKQLADARPYLQDIDGSTIANFLRQVQESLKATDQLDVEGLFKQLKEVLPKPMTEHPQFDTLLTELQDTGKELKGLLTEDFIAHLQHIIHFWPHFVATVPSWTHIMGVYFISLTVSSSTLPMFFNALKVITEVILEQKGGLALGLTALPLLLLTVLILPVNIMLQSAKQMAWIGIKEGYKAIGNGLSLIGSLFSLLGLVLGNSDKTFTQVTFSLFESIFNLSVRLSINVFIELLNAAIYIISGKSPLSPLLESINTGLDSFFDMLRPAVTLPQEQPGEVTLVKVEDNAQTKTQPSGEAQSLGFFANSNLPLHNQEDVWLKNLLSSLSDEPQSEKEEVQLPMYKVV